jgi:MFS family permease
MMCPFGYNNETVGLCLGWFIGAGSIGSLVFGYLADRTGKLEEISKILYAASSVAYILLVLV